VVVCKAKEEKNRKRKGYFLSVIFYELLIIHNIYINGKYTITIK
jgi:hypothetical protein